MKPLDLLDLFLLGINIIIIFKLVYNHGYHKGVLDAHDIFSKVIKENLPPLKVPPTVEDIVKPKPKTKPRFKFTDESNQQ